MVPKPDEPVSRAATTATPTAAPPTGAASAVEFSAEALRAIWPSIVEAVKAEKRLLGTALADTTLAEVAPPIVAVMMKEENPMVAENLERSREVLERIIGGRVGAAVRFEVRPPAGGGPGAARPRRRTDASDRAERMQQLRAKDPTLDAAAEALDLELTD